jgi:hypothetical protein
LPAAGLAFAARLKISPNSIKIRMPVFKSYFRAALATHPYFYCGQSAAGTDAGRIHLLSGGLPPENSDRS